MDAPDRALLPDRYRTTPRTLCFVTHADAVLLLQGAPDKRLFPGAWNGVGGHVEAGEDVYASARREIREETGLEVSDLRLSGVVNVPDAERATEGVLLFVFRAASPSRAVRASPEGRLAWIPRGELEALPLVEDLPLLLPRVLDAEPGEAPFFARYARTPEGRLRAYFSP